MKKVVTRRYAPGEYFALKQRVLNLIREHVTTCDVPREFPGKESYGDLDVLIVCPTPGMVRKLIENLFHPTEIVHNGDVYSFDLEEFQIDFILVPKEQFDNAIVYFSYSDLGSLIGNVCHKIGLKYGIQGLWMNVHTKEFDPTTTSTKLILSTDPRQIFDFLGYDYDRYAKGMEDENEFFQWVIEGKYFRSHYFDDDQLNHAHRHRTHKRPIYIRFKEYVNKRQAPGSETGQSREDQEELIRTVRQQALIYFKKQEEYEKGLVERDEKRQLRNKYSGCYFLDIKCRKDMIRVHMKNFERRIAKTDEEFQQWVNDTDEEQIKAEIEKYKQELKQNES